MTRTKNKGWPSWAPWALGPLALLLVGAVTTVNLDNTLRHEQIYAIRWLGSSSTGTANTDVGAVNTSSTASMTGQPSWLYDDPVAVGNNNVVGTTSIAQPLYPTRLGLRILDADGGQTLTCSSAELWGISSMGTDVYEKITTITETFQNTTYSYSRLTKVKFNTCNPGHAQHKAQVVSTAWLALPKPIRKIQDVIAICRSAAGDGREIPQCFSRGNINLLTFHRQSNSINLGTAAAFTAELASQGGLSLTKGNNVTVRYLAPSW